MPLTPNAAAILSAVSASQSLRCCPPASVGQKQAQPRNTLGTEGNLDKADDCESDQDSAIGYFSWGAYCLRYRDYAAAIDIFAVAHERGPEWADPVEGWGDALAAEGKYQEVIAKYSAASEYTPQWGALKLRRGAALEALGSRTQARSLYNKAAHLALPDDDQRTVTRRLSTTQP